MYDDLESLRINFHTNRKQNYGLFSKLTVMSSCDSTGCPFRSAGL